MRPRYRARPPHPPMVTQRSGRPFAPGDPPLQHEALELGVPFSFDAAFGRRLKRRDVHPREAFTVRDPSGTYYRASLKELTPEGGTAVPYEIMPRAPEPSIEITLGCAVLARQRMIFVMQKATELGATRVVPLFTAYSVRPEGLEHEKAHAWPGQVVRATKQCRRGSLPEVKPPMRLEEFLLTPEVAEADLCVYLDDRAAPAPIEPPRPRSLVLLVGPEGGFSEEERRLLGERGVPWVLGGRVLRTETAVLVGLAACHLAWGDFAPLVPRTPRPIS